MRIGGDVDQQAFRKFSEPAFRSLTDKAASDCGLAVYPGAKFRADQDFTIRMDLLTSGFGKKGGIAFFWLDAGSFDDIAKSVDTDNWEQDSQGKVANTAESFAKEPPGYGLSISLPPGVAEKPMAARTGFENVRPTE